MSCLTAVRQRATASRLLYYINLARRMVEELPVGDAFGKWDESLRETYRLVPTDDPYLLRQLDSYRRGWEALHKPEPRKEGFTSQLGKEEKEKMLVERPVDYFAGLPQFARSFFQRQASAHAKHGDLDDQDPQLIAAFVSRRGRSR